MHSSWLIQTCPGKKPGDLAWCDSLPMFCVNSAIVAALMTSFWVPMRWDEFQEPSFPEPADRQAGKLSCQASFFPAPSGTGDSKHERPGLPGPLGVVLSGRGRTLKEQESAQY